MLYEPTILRGQSHFAGALLDRRTIGRLLVWLIVVAPAFLDLAHGFLSLKLGVNVLASSYRGLLLLIGLSLLVLRPRWPIVFAILAYCIFYSFEFMSWSVNSQLMLGGELLSATNFVFLFACYVSLSYSVRYFDVTVEDILTAVISYGKITALIVILSLTFDIGVATYSNNVGAVYGFGTQSYYLAGNVLGLSLVVALAVAIHRYVTTFRFRTLAEALLIFAGAFCIGTRTGMLGAAVLMAGGVFYFIFFSSGPARYRLCLSIIAIPIFVYGAFKTYELVTQYSFMVSKLDALLTGQIRGEHADAAYEYMSTRRLPNQLTGDGYAVYIRAFAQYSPKRLGIEFATAEQDPLDVVGAYGIFGLVALYLPLALAFLVSGINTLIRRNPLSAVTFLSLSLILSHSIIAGHVIFSAQSLQFASIFLVMAFATGVSRESPNAFSAA